LPGQKRKRQEALRALIRRHRIATQEELVHQLDRIGITATQATVSRDIAELGLVRTAGPDGRYAHPAEGLGGPSSNGREERLRRLLRDLPLTVKRGQGIAVLITTPGSAHTIAEEMDAAAWPEVLGTLAGDDTIFVALRQRKSAYAAVAQRLSRLGAYVQPED